MALDIRLLIFHYYSPFSQKVLTSFALIIRNYLFETLNLAKTPPLDHICRCRIVAWPLEHVLVPGCMAGGHDGPSSQAPTLSGRGERPPPGVEGTNTQKPAI